MSDLYERTPSTAEEAYAQIGEILNERIQYNNQVTKTLFIRVVLGILLEAVIVLILKWQNLTIPNLGIALIIFNIGITFVVYKPFSRCLNKKMIYANAKDVIAARGIEDPFAFVEQLKDEYNRGVR